jgi:hypothetical protein
MFDWGYFFNVFIVFSILWIVGQRVAVRHRRGFRIAVILFAALWLWWRFQLFPWEMVWALMASLLVSFVFWLLIGRYNPVGNEDDEKIKVYGLDD